MTLFKAALYALMFVGMSLGILGFMTLAILACFYSPWLGSIVMFLIFWGGITTFIYLNGHENP